MTLNMKSSARPVVTITNPPAFAAMSLSDLKMLLLATRSATVRFTSVR